MPAEAAPATDSSEEPKAEEPKAEEPEPKAEEPEPKAEESNGEATAEPKAEEAEAKGGEEKAKAKATKTEKSRNGTAKSSAKAGAKTSSSRSSSRSSKSGPPLKLPKWCGFPSWHKNRNVRFEVYKDGKKGKEIYLMRRPYFVLGKLPGNEIQLDHPSISRKHSMLLHHKFNGTLHLVDLKSAHGTYLRDEKIKPGMNNMVTVAEGDVLRFGASTRTYVLKGTAQVERASKSGGNIGPAGPPAGTLASREAAQKRKRAGEGEYETVKTVRKALTPAARLMLRRKQQEREALARRENLRKMAGSHKTIITGLTAKVVPIAKKVKKAEAVSVAKPATDGTGGGMVDEEEAAVVEEGEKAENGDGAAAEAGTEESTAMED